jgi:hypothetical protein
MKLLVSDEWLRKRLADEDEPGGCSHCGAIAGCCEKYPDCPGGNEAEQSRLPANEEDSREGT